MVQGCPTFIAGNAMWSCTSDRFQSTEVLEYEVLHRVLSTELPHVELDRDFEAQFTNIFETTRELVNQRWERRVEDDETYL
ncbi:hypothetical protein PT974_12509 [Cladobotryum mycophilum]|uniref:Uncharacterized protein n=1 Tax=Cladobotryum mycophilum TaxID=491253 RepID=A0ABR0S860_9HYPO